MSPPHDTPHRIDWLLRLPPALEARHEAATGAARVAALQRSILVGTVLYNMYNFTSIYLLSDILWLSVALRTLLITPATLAIVWMIGHVSGAWRERILAIATVNAMAGPVFLFWLSSDPRAPFTVGEMSLLLVFANIVAILRFRYALASTATCFLIAVLGIAAKSDLDPLLVPAFSLQLATACLVALYGNWLVERHRCVAFIAEVDATRRADDADRSSRAFRDLSMTDALTGLPNRRALDAEMERLAAAGGALAVLMLDIDHFKLFNDRFGHPAGDDCLRVVGACLSRTAADAGAWAARFGGEEFCLLLADASPFEAARLASAAVEAVRGLGLPHAARFDGTDVVTVSVGLACASRTDAGASGRLLASADSALYVAKQRGRNRWSADNMTDSRTG